MSLAEPAPVTRSGGRYSDAILDDDRLDGDSTPRASEPVDDDAGHSSDPKKDGKTKKRSLFGFGKKKTTNTKSAADDANSESQPTSESKTASAATSPPTLSRDTSATSAKLSAARSTTSPSQGEHAFAVPSSPNRGFSGSPRLSSPATSQIFERDVQDSTVLKPTSPAIPTHIQTENYIPPVLDDASEAITNEKLDPDAVEIVTHSLHQPAAVTVTSAHNPPSAYEQTASEWAAELASFADRGTASGDNISNFGSLDSSDVRRLSFISFADVVQAEQTGPVPSSRDSIHLVGLTSLPAALNRSPSPIRSPVSSQGMDTSPPTSNPGSMKGLELSPVRKPLGSPTSANNLSVGGGDLNIETMSQALRRTGSTDLSLARSTPQSPTEAGTRM